MKIPVIILVLLIAQVSASFFDVFHGAVLSVQNSVGKLLSDVVTDVRDTVDCTILAVEHVLSLSDDATIRYYEKCGSGTNKTAIGSSAPQDQSIPKVEVSVQFPNNEEYLQKVIPAEIDARINETLSKVLGDYKPHNNLISIENVLAKESEQLTEVSDLVKKELKKLSNEVNTDFENIKHRDSEPSVDAILQEIKLLEKREQDTRNTSEANEIHHVIDEVLSKLDAIEATEATENIKLEEILKDLEKNSNNSFVGLRQQFEEWKEEELRHIGEIKNKIEVHEKNFDHLGSYNGIDSNHTQPDMNKDDIQSPLKSQEISLSNCTQETNDSTIRNNNVQSLKPTANERVSSFESPPSIGTSELSSLSITIGNKVNGDNSNETVAKTKLTITDYAHINESVQLEESSSSAPNEPTTLFKSLNNLNKTVIINNPIHTTEITLVEVTDSAESNTDSGKEKSVDGATNNNSIITSTAGEGKAGLTLVTLNLLINNSSDNKVMTSTTIALVDKTPVNETTSENVARFTLPINELALATTLDNETSDTFVTSTSSSTEVSLPVNKTILPIETNTTVANEESEATTDMILTSTNLPILKGSQVSEIIQPVENTQVSYNEGTTTLIHDNNTLITSTRMPVSETIEEETTTASSNNDSLTVTMNGLISTSRIVNNNNLSDSIMPSTPTSIISTPVSETIQVENTFTDSDESSTLNQNKPTDTPNTTDEDDDNSNKTVATSTSVSILEGILVKNKTTNENLDTSIYTSDSPIASSTALIDTDTNSNPNTQLPITETTLSSEIKSVEHTALTENEEITTLSTNQPTTIPNKVINDDYNSNDFVASTTFKTTASTDINDHITIVETIASSEKQELSPIQTTTMYAPTESIFVSKTRVERTTDSRNEKQLGNLMPLETNTTTPNMLPNSLQLTITETPLINKNTPTIPVNRKRLTAKRHNNMTPSPTKRYNQQPPNPNPLLSNHHNAKRKASETDSTRNRYSDINNDVSTSSTPVNSDPKLLTPDKLIPNQQPFEDEEHIKAVFDALSSINERLMNSKSPILIDDEIKKIANVLTTPDIGKTYPPRKLIDPQIINNKNPPYGKKPKHPIRPPYTIDRPSANTYRPPRGLTTYRPTSKTARKNNLKNAPVDDSFLHMPQKDTEAHQRALREARQLIENSKRSNRIMESILKNKDNNGARSIFNKSGPLNTGK